MDGERRERASFRGGLVPVRRLGGRRAGTAAEIPQPDRVEESRRGRSAETTRTGVSGEGRAVLMLCDTGSGDEQQEEEKGRCHGMHCEFSREIRRSACGVSASPRPVARHCTQDSRIVPDPSTQRHAAKRPVRLRGPTEGRGGARRFPRETRPRVPHNLPTVEQLHL